jgi:hypothetical protein
MGTAAQPTREHRTITVDFRSEAMYFQLLGDGKAFLECVLAFVMSLGFQRKHKATCRGGWCLTRHSYYVRVRLGGLTIWRIQCTRCKVVFTVLLHFVLRSRQMRPEVARDALLATPGGLSLEWCAVIYHLSPMALYRLVCAFGHQSLVTVLTRCGLPLPTYFLVDEKHSCCVCDIRASGGGLPQACVRRGVHDGASIPVGAREHHAPYLRTTQISAHAWSE